MMAYRVNYSVPTAKVFMSEGNSQRGPDASGYQPYRSFGMGAGFGREGLRQNQTKFPVMQPLSSYGDGKALLGRFVVGGTPNLPKDNRPPGSDNINQNSDICGRHFLFDQSCVGLERTRTAIPPLPRGYPVSRLTNLHPFDLSKELSHTHAGRPFTFGYPRRCEVNTSSAILFPTTLVLKGRNTFSVENAKLSRPKVKYPTYHPMTVKDNLKSQSYPDPVVGAPHSFIHRISELSSLEGETMRQETLKKMKKCRKPPS